MTTLKQQAAEDIRIFMENGLPWIDTAVYTPQIGDPVSVNVIFEKEGFNDPDTYETKAFTVSISIRALLADLGQTPCAKTATAPGDTFTIDSIVYEVTAIDELDNDFVECKVKER